MDVKVESSTQLFRFTGQNFPLYKYQLQIVLEGKEFFKVVDGTELCPIDGDPAFINAWKKKNSAARAIIATLVDMEHLHMLVTCKTAKDMWDRLTSIYEQVYEESLFLLMQQFFNCEYQAGDSIAKHVAQLEFIAISLEGLGEKFSEQQNKLSQ